MVRQNINERTYIIGDDLAEKKVETIALGMMERNEIKGLLSLRLINQDERKYFRYDVTESESLKQWITEVHDRKETLTLLRSLIDVKEEVESFLMETNHLCTEPEYIHVQENRCKFVYVPIVDYCGRNLLCVAQYILESLRYAQDEDYTYVYELLNAFSRDEIKSDIEFKKWLRIFDSGNSFPDIEQEKKGAAVLPDNENLLQKDSESYRENLERSEKDTENKKKFLFGKKEKSGRKTERKKSNLSGLLDEMSTNEKKAAYSLQNKKEGIENLREKDDSISFSQQKYINILEDDSSTLYVGDSDKGYLVQKSTGKEFWIEEAEYTIGSIQTAGIYIRNNTAVSRCHAKLFYINEEYYLEDLHSTNGTYVNGEKIPSGEKRRLIDNTRIKFANEEFTFELRRR